MRLFSLLIALFTLAACGFTPVYQKTETGKEVQHKLEDVTIAEIKQGRMGQMLRTELTHNLGTDNKSGAPYLLTITMDRKKEEQAIRQDREVTRYILRINGQYRLTDQASGKELAKGTSMMTASYDAVGSDFATYALEQDTERRLVKEMARDIHFRLVRHFSR